MQALLFLCAAEECGEDMVLYTLHTAQCTLYILHHTLQTLQKYRESLRVSQMLTIADEGGGRVREKFDKMGLRVPKMCVKETN